ncbi:MAG TPA: YHYH protein [Porticoccaceae bacterium]|nr:YHYH protein [Porticoccaceae bacterium]
MLKVSPLFFNGVAKLCLFLSTICLLAVCAFHYPEYLTTATLREIYTDEQARILLLGGMLITLALSVSALFFALHKSSAATALLLLFIAWLAAGTGVSYGGAYHYHGTPEGFVDKLEKGTEMTLVAWAADVFPIYARYGYQDAMDASSEILIVESSYRHKSSLDANRPSVSDYAMGAFTQDYECVAGSVSSLDECNGRTGVTPEFPEGIYHYYATNGFPFLQRCVKGAL